MSGKSSTVNRKDMRFTDMKLPARTKVYGRGFCSPVCHGEDDLCIFNRDWICLSVAVSPRKRGVILRAAEAECIVKRLIAEGRIPVIAHAERCRKLTVSDFAECADMGCLIQINAYSLVEEHNTDTKTKARELLSRRLVSFIGSDAHTSYHRPPNYTSGVQYILDNCEPDYAQAVLYKNAEMLLK